MSTPSPDNTEQVGQVRHLIADLMLGDDQVFDDDEIDTYLALNDGNVRRAAADALDAIAVSELLVSKVIRTQDLQTDGAKVAAELRARAKDLRDRADAVDDQADWFGFDVAYPPLSGRSGPEHTNPLVTGL
ncbi:hypothetical protein ACI3EY_08010 [Ornithinimicrobium sp. LYQ92]|uniref:hypothetical protein n=1 Tax=Serinicoccus sp. LYQ92 TaxID=3378798 RepID=UPI003852DEFB